VISLFSGAVFLFILSLETVAGAGEPGKEEILKKLREKYSSMNDLSASYKRVTASPAMDNVFMSASRDQASGRLIFKKPNRLYMDQHKPDPQKMITDGVTLWWYIPEENLAQKFQGAEFSAEVKPLLDFLNGLDRLEAGFKVSLAPPAEKPPATHELILTSLKADSQLKGLTIRLDPVNYNLLGFQMVTALGETTDFFLADLKFNQGFSDAIFQFKAPEGVEVIVNNQP